MCITAKEPNMYDLMRKLPIGIHPVFKVFIYHYLEIIATFDVYNS